MQVSYHNHVPIGCWRPMNVNGQKINGRIMLERVSKNSEVVRKTKHRQFTADALANYELRNGNWKNLHASKMTVDDLCDVILDSYDLDEYV